MKTNIPYCDEAINGVVGCTQISPACDNCWSKELHDMRHKAYSDYRNFCERTGKVNYPDMLPKQYAKPFSEIQLLPERLEELKHLKKPRTIFMCSGSDLFHPEVPFDFIHNVFEATQKAWQHTYLILTKRPPRLAEFIKTCAINTNGEHTRGIYHYGRAVPHCNVIMGITIWNQESADRDIPILLDCWKGKKWLSIEPLLGEVDLRYITNLKPTHMFSAIPPIPKIKDIDYVVAGCESGHNRRPCKDEWLDSIEEQCKAAGVPCLIKQREVDGKVVACKECKDFFRRTK